MGLLTDPVGFHGRPVRLLVENQSKISYLMVAMAAASYCLLAHDQVNTATYLSENALLPGLVTVGCDVGSEADTILAELEAEIRSREDSKIPTSWIKSRLYRAGIEVYTHNFTLNYPLGKGAKFTGKNVYGIIRGGGASTEAIVLSVPFRGKSSVHPSTNAGLALMLAIGGCFRKQKYWAKDIILLVTEHEQLGMEAWLEAYHGTTCGTPGVLEAGELSGRGGSIQAAVNLQVYSPKVKVIDVKLCGLNGQLPNLDLANLVHRICSKERVRHSFTNKEKIYHLGSNEQWLHSLDTMTSMLLTQATGIPDGNHGLFHRFGIEAVTLEGVSDDVQGPDVSLRYIGRVIEGVFRSMNNLLERFHQSYFFYLLVDTDRFVSIGMYMPCVGLMVGALFIRAFTYYINVKDLLQSVLVANRGPTKPELPNANFFGVGVAVLSCYGTGLAASNLARLFTLAFPSDWRTEDSIFYGFSALTVATIVIPPIVLRWTPKDTDWTMLLIASLVHFGSLLIAVAMHNFSLAFVAGLYLAPIVLCLVPSRNSWLRKTAMVCAHPLVLLLVCVGGAASFHFPREELFWRTLSGSKQALVLGVVDSMVYGSWTLNVALLFYLPNWLMLWTVAHSKYSCLDPDSEFGRRKAAASVAGGDTAAATTSDKKND